MNELDTLIKALQKEWHNAVECQTLNTALKDEKYKSYLKGKEEAYNLSLQLLNEFKRLTSENKN